MNHQQIIFVCTRCASNHQTKECVAKSGGELILKIEYLAAKLGKVVIKINPKHSSLECRNCGHIDKSNRNGEKFICIECGYHEHADIGAAKTIRHRGLFLSKWGLRETRCLSPKRPKDEPVAHRGLSK